MGPLVTSPQALVSLPCNHRHLISAFDLWHIRGVRSHKTPTQAQPSRRAIRKSTALRSQRIKPPESVFGS